MKFQLKITLLIFTISHSFQAYCQNPNNHEKDKFKEEIRTHGFSGNPIIKHIFTADPAALVYNDTFYIYTGHDEAAVGGNGYVMKDWHIFSSTDMINWKDHGACLSLNTFSWAKSDAWAGQCVHKDGKFYWYVPVYHKTISGFSIGVAVSDSPTGPFKDAKGSALITNDMTTDLTIFWDDIDPAVFVDDDGQAYLYWGNTKCKYVKLRSNMIETDGPIQRVDIPAFTEAPWLHKRNGVYYLSYAAGIPENIDYATSDSPTGPWAYQGRINERVSSPTNHQAIVEYKGKWYFVYHNADLPNGGEFRRSVCIDTLHYNPDGSIATIIQTTKGVPALNGSTSINDEVKKNFKIYPNPVNKGILNIDLTSIDIQFKKVRVEILNYSGSALLTSRFNPENTLQLPVRLQSGFYILKLITSGKIYTTKIVVK